MNMVLDLEHPRPFRGELSPWAFDSADFFPALPPRNRGEADSDATTAESA